MSWRQLEENIFTGHGALGSGSPADKFIFPGNVAEGMAKWLYQVDCRKYPVWCALPVVEHCLQFTTLECDGCDSPDENDHRIRKNTLNWVMCCQKNIHCTVCMPVFNIKLYLTTGQVYLQSSVSCVFLWGKLSLWFVLEVKWQLLILAYCSCSDLTKLLTGSLCYSDYIQSKFSFASRLLMSVRLDEVKMCLKVAGVVEVWLRMELLSQIWACDDASVPGWGWQKAAIWCSQSPGLWGRASCLSDLDISQELTSLRQKPLLCYGITLLLNCIIS